MPRTLRRLAGLSRTLRTAAAASLLMAAGARTAEATWSIIIIDTRTGEIAIGSATCLSGFDLEQNASIVVPGIGAAAAQSFVDQTGQNRVFIHDQLLRGTDPTQIITLLAGFDSGHQTRQYGIVDLRSGGRAATFTGTGAGQYRGGRTGRVVGAGTTGGDLVYAVQGNVLTGAPVIDAAVAAIENEAGDLPEKLMRAMEEAMRLGGDGRCSCSQGNPTGCGAPPPQFVRSAYIGYMIISREGDRPGCNGIYRVNGTAPASMVAADLNRDGAPELIACNQSSATVSVLTNAVASEWATFGLPMLFPVGASPRDIVAGDFTGDGWDDVAVAAFNVDAVSVLRSTSGGTLIGRTDVPVGDGPISLVTGDFDSDGDVDIAAANQLGVSVGVLVNDGAGVFTPATPVLLPAAPTAMAAGDLDADGDADLVVAVTATPSDLHVLRNTSVEGGAPTFMVEQAIPAGRGVSSLAIGRLDGDERPDVAALAQTDAQVNVFLQGEAGFGAMNSLAFVSLGSGLALGDVNADGITDIVSASRSSPPRMAHFLGRGDGSFDAARFFAIGFAPARFALKDLNLDGLPDLAAPLINNNQALTVRNFGGGVFNSNIGCAAGDYFMNLNVANVPANAPDPVPVLRNQFNAMRSDMLGQTDAIRSVITLDPPAVRADGVNAAALVMDLRDWQGNRAASSPARSIEIIPSGLGVVAGPVELQGDGTYRAMLTSGEQSGEVRLGVVVRDSPVARAVRLMPEPGLRLLDRADWDLSGAVNSGDFMLFLDDFMNDRADFDHNGVVSSQDFFDFLTAFFGAR